MLPLTALFGSANAGFLPNILPGVGGGGQNGCPSSNGIIHAGCSYNVEFQNSCEEVAEEIKARASAPKTQWQDPHNHGTYTLLSSEGSSEITTKRLTGNGVFTDEQTFHLTPQGENACSVFACSNSQGISAADGGTNFCDTYDLYCNKEACNDGNCCNVLKYDLQYQISNKKCWPFQTNCPSDPDATCIKMTSMGTDQKPSAVQSRFRQLVQEQARHGKKDGKETRKERREQRKEEKKERREAKKEDKKEGKHSAEKKDQKKDDKKQKDDDKKEGKCMNPTDEAKFPDLVPDMQGCGAVIKKNHYRGLKALGEFKKCMASQYGFTKDCTECQGTFVACRALHCTKKCGAKDGKPEQLWEEPCFDCVAMCAEKMAKCGGLDKASSAQCQKMFAGSLGWVCDVLEGTKTVAQVYKQLEPMLKPKTPGMFELDIPQLIAEAANQLS